MFDVSWALTSSEGRCEEKACKKLAALLHGIKTQRSVGIKEKLFHNKITL